MRTFPSIPRLSSGSPTRRSSFIRAASGTGREPAGKDPPARSGKAGAE